MYMSDNTNTITNGPGAAAILAAGIGCFLIGLFFLFAEASPTAKSFFTFYKPSGALSGITTSAVVIWLVSWLLLSRAWRKRNVNMWWINLTAFLLLALSLLLTFPPVIEMLLELGA
mgnify:FL=1